jgi:hypothetical protein
MIAPQYNIHVRTAFKSTFIQKRLHPTRHFLVMDHRTNTKSKKKHITHHRQKCQPEQYYFVLFGTPTSSNLNKYEIIKAFESITTYFPSFRISIATQSLRIEDTGLGLIIFAIMHGDISEGSSKAIQKRRGVWCSSGTCCY